MGVVLANQFTPVLLAFKKMDSYVILCAKKAIKELGQIASRSVQKVGVTMDFSVTNLKLTVAFLTAPKACVCKMLKHVKKTVLYGIQLAKRDSSRLVAAFVLLRVQKA
jgi:hypothetical protein